MPALRASKSWPTCSIKMSGLPGFLRKGIVRLRIVLLDSERLVNHAAFHYETDAAQRGNVTRRIAFDCNQVREESCFDSAKLVFLMQYARVNRSRRPQRIDDRHSPVHHCFDLARVVAVREDANVAAIGNRDSGFERLFEYRLFTFR